MKCKICNDKLALEDYCDEICNGCEFNDEWDDEEDNRLDLINMRVL